MAHNHIIIDADKHFIIDPATREITNQSDKIKLMQHDHNSERFTFELPKEIDGHDMSLCNTVRVLYVNIDGKKMAENPGVYKVDDLQISSDGEKVIGSWLISSNATKYAGSLNFKLRFKCVAADGTIEYAWNTAIFKGISIGDGYNNDADIAEKHADIFRQWEARIEALEKGGTGLTEAQIKALDEMFKIASYTENPSTAYKTFKEAFGLDTETPTEALYQEVEYIEFDGNSFIQTNEPAANKFEFDITASFPQATSERTLLSLSTETQGLVTMGHSATPNRMFFFCDYSAAITDIENLYNSVVHAHATYETNVGKTFTLEVDGKTYTATNDSTKPLTDAKFAIGTSGYDSARYAFIGKLYHASYIADDVLVCDLIPCYRKSDNEVGLYNKVNGMFYANAGTGTLTAGGNI